MPYLINEGEKIHFPFDPDTVAEAIFRGFKVEPDEGLSADEINTHNLLINQSLEKLWGGKNLRANPSRGEIPPWKSEENVAPEMSLPKINRGADFLDVEPNPTKNFLLRKIPFETPFDALKRAPKVTNADPELRQMLGFNYT